METYNREIKIFLEDVGMQWNPSHTRKRRMYRVQCPTCGAERIVAKHNYVTNISTRCENCNRKKNPEEREIRQYWNYVKLYYNIIQDFKDFQVFKEWLITTNWKKGHRAHTYNRLFSRDTVFTKNSGLPYKAFVTKATKNHNGAYIYNESYVDKIPKVITVTCPIHGDFQANLVVHAQGGHVCPSCYKQKMKTQIGNYSYTEWEQQGLASKNFDSFKVYILEIITEQGALYKIGKTFLTADARFNNSTLPYSYKVIEYYEGSAKLISEFEHELHDINKQTKIIPEKHFHGMNECFKTYMMPINTLQRGLTHTKINKGNNT